MNYIQGNLWDFHTVTTPVCITTNTIIKANGELVMGAGIARQAKLRFPSLPRYAGKLVRDHGDVVIYCPKPYNLFLFPTKHDWRNPSKVTLIQQSAGGLSWLVNMLNLRKVYLTPPGCGNGGLSWAQVEPILTPYLDNRFYIVTPSS